MSTVLFLSEQALKDASLINENVDMKLLTPVIEYCQEYYLIPVLGSRLYDDVVSAIVAGTVSADYKNLLDNYVQPALKWWVMVEAPLSLTYKYTNKSVATKSSDNSQPANMKDLQALSDNNRRKAEWYSQRITNFLLAHRDIYPLYLEQGDITIDTVRPQIDAYTSGLNLDPDRDISHRISYEELYQGKFGIPPLS